MAQIGRSLPPGQARRLAEKRLTPGTVVLLQVTFPQTRETKEKFLVYAGSDGDHCYFVVNSKIHRLIEKNPDLLRCQVVIDAANHPFLKHDSHVACHQVHRIPAEDVYAALCDDLGRIKGTISTAVRNQIISAVKHAVTIAPVTQNIIIASLTPDS